MKWLMRKFALTESGAKGVIKAIRASFFVNAGYMAAMMIIMYFSKNVIDGNFVPLSKYLIITGIVGIAIYIFLDIEYRRTYNTTYKEAKDLRIDIANQLKKMPLSYFSKHDLSDLAQTIMQDVLDLEHTVSHAIPQSIGYGLFLVLIIIVMFISNFKLALAMTVPIAITILILWLSKKSQVAWTKKFFWRLRENAEIFQETIEMQQEIKSYGFIEESKEKVDKSLDDYEKLHLISESKQAIPVAFSFAILKLSIGAVVLCGASLLAKNEVELIYVLGFLIGTVKLIDAISVVQEGIAELFCMGARSDRINELRNVKLQQGRDVELKNFDIEFKNVSFGYNEETKVLDNISFVAKQGEVTAIVGPSGCGKTTVLKLVSRLYDYDSGSIVIDGYDIKDISTDSLFDKVSMVFQDVILFNASIMENIRIGNPNATDEEVKIAARAANCEEFINKLPGGYDCLIGENGSKLSGGERQRLSIARAFLKNAPILLLDEISASLDVENEMKIQDSLNKLIQDKTVIIISHRLKSVEGVDKIIVMNSGKIENIGTNEELLSESILYKKLIEKSNLTEQFTY